MSSTEIPKLLRQVIFNHLVGKVQSKTNSSLLQEKKISRTINFVTTLIFFRYNSCLE